MPHVPNPSANKKLSLVLSLFILLVCDFQGAYGQMVSGVRMPGYAQTLGVVLNQKSYPYSAQLISIAVPGNILNPGEAASFTFQLVNNTDKAIAAKAKVELIRYATRGIPGDIWTPQMYKIADAGSTPIDVDIAAKGFQDITVTPTVPAEFGAYALVVDLGEHGRAMVGTFVRTFPVSSKRVQYSKLCLDSMPLDVLKRLGVHAIRYEVSYKPTTEKDFPEWLEKHAEKLKALQDANITTMFMVGGPGFFGDWEPLKRPRPWLDDKAVMLDTKFDLAWLPSYDPDFQKFCHILAAKFGWPKGPCTAFYLWNEPWEGLSIAGWGADMLRYREIFTHMCQGVEEARKDDGVQVLLGGFDSTSNAMDKMFGDGSDEFLKWCDFISIHYQGLDAHTTVKKWVNRKSLNGHVRIWDTESWIANTDDRVAGAIAADRAAGYDRAMGIFGGNISSAQDANIRTADGKTKRVSITEAWPVAASVGAANHFIGERAFRELLFKNGLPWVMVFDGDAMDDGTANPEDATVVVVGDLGEEFKPDDLPFRTARGFAEIAHKKELRKQLAAMPADAPALDRKALETAISKPEVAQRRHDDNRRRSALQPVRFLWQSLAGEGRKDRHPARWPRIFPPRRRQAGLRRSTASRNPHLARRRDRAVGDRRTRHDCANRKTSGSPPFSHQYSQSTRERKIDGNPWKVEAPATGRADCLRRDETKEIEIPITAGESVSDNTYPLSVSFDAGADGTAVHEEAMHVNVIPRRTITVDGNLDDWKDIPPQIIKSAGPGGPTLTEAAWLPFMKFDQSVGKGLATGYMAYDNDNFYFAAKIADDTPDEGMPRFETLNPDEFFYPEVCYRVDREHALQKKDMTWAESTADVRALQKPGADGKDRVAAAWATTLQSFAIDLKLPKGQPRRVALYLLDWIQPGQRGAVVEIIDNATGRSMARNFFTRLSYGKYVVYDLAGNIRIKISATNGAGAALSGIFFDPAPANAKAKGTSGKYLKTDEDTQGNWKGVYGADGYNVIGADAKYPHYVTVDLPNVVNTEEFHWPQGVRRFSYRKNPQLPAGNFPRHDNVQIAFNVLRRR